MGKVFFGTMNRRTSHRVFASMVLALYLLGFCPQGMPSGGKGVVGKAEALPTTNWQEAGNFENAFAGGTGTDTDPYKIATAGQLAYLAQQVNAGAAGFADAHYILTADIDLGAHLWTPIGTSDKPFKGTFDGGGFVISKLFINAPGAEDQGLFGCTRTGAAIMNVGLKDVNVTGERQVGGLVGGNYGDTITSCYATGSVTGTDSLVGGLVGYNFGGTIQTSYATGSVTGTVSNTGGLVGYNSGGTIETSYATGSVSGGILSAASSGVTSPITVVPTPK